MTEVKERDVNWAIRCVVQTAHDSAYRSDAQKSKKDAVPDGIRKVALAVPANAATKATLAIAATLRAR